MTSLSPAAQAQKVLDAANGASSYGPDDCLNESRQIAAAALQAAVDQVVPHLDEPDWGACNNGHCDIELYADHQRKRAKFLAIAAELGGTTTNQRG
jgi:hypothetical protein